MGAFATTASPQARADGTPTRAVRIDYEAPLDCPTSAEFAAELRARSPRVVVTRDDDALGLVVHLRRDGHRVVGAVVVRAGNAPASRREVDGASCAEVASALAFIASVAADPTAAADTPTRAAPAAAGITPPSSTALAAAAPEPPPSAPPTGGERARATPSEAPSVTPRDAPRVDVSLGALVGVAQGVAPVVALPWSAFVDVARAPGGDASLGSALRVRAEHAETGDLPSSGATATFARTTVAVDLCGALFARRARIALCVRAEAGAFYAAARDVTPARSALRPWLAVGPAVHASVDVVGPAFVAFEASATAPFVRDRFFVEPDRTLFRASVVGVTTALGAGVRFP